MFNGEGVMSEVEVGVLSRLLAINSAEAEITSEAAWSSSLVSFTTCLIESADLLFICAALRSSLIADFILSN